MGIIRAALGATLGTLADQWKDYFCCDALDSETLVVKGTKVLSGRSGNRYGSDNIISQGSGLVVNEGQCVMIVDQGVVTEVVAEPGYFTYDSDAEPSIFAGELNEERLRAIFETMWRRFQYGGGTGRDQRVYFFNMKEIVDNKFGTAVPVPFRVVDRNIGLDLDVSLRCNGLYSFKITDPISFFANVCGNVKSEYRVEELRGQLKAEFISALQPALSKLSELQIRPYALPSQVGELCKVMNAELSEKWTQLRGLSIVSIAINSVTLPEDDAKILKDLQRGAAMRDPGMAAAQLAAAQAAAMTAAASNSAGAVTGLMGMGMAQQSGGLNATELFKTAAAQSSASASGGTQNSWQCSCGTVNQGKFCTECGKPRPEGQSGWRCECGGYNLGKFCQYCGKRKPADAPLYVCDKCGYKPQDPYHPPKFCPECGDPFTEDDRVN
ncbi:MAG: SPFH domain-containing protein [Succinivibrio sp.]|nr:SPFH domain-containing protein [Succinivibrio sp.]